MVRAWLPLSLLSTGAAMQVHDHHEHMDFAAMKSSMLGMAKRAQETGKIDVDAVAAINGFLKTIKDQLYPAIDADRSSVQASLDAANAAITQCNTDRTTWKTDQLPGLNSDVSNWNSKHNDCRVTEQSTYETYEEKCSEFHSRVCNWDNCPCPDFSAGDTDDVDEYICCVQDFFSEHRTAYYAELQACEDATSAHHNQTAVCDRNQQRFQDEFCAREDAIQNKCEWYDGCRCERESEFEKIKAEAADLESIFQTQWVALNQLSCYGEEMLKDITDLSGCEHLSNDCEGDHSHNTDGSAVRTGCPKIVEPTPDDFIPCEEPHGSYPCHSDWITEFYGWLATDQPCTPYDDCSADECGIPDVASNKWGANGGARHSGYASCSV